MTGPDSPSSPGLLQDAMARHRAGELGPAIELYRRHLEAAPDDVRAWCLLASAEGQSGRHGGAGAAYEQALALDPSLAAAHAGLGTSRLQQGDFRGAETALRRAVELDPALVDARLQLAMVCRRQGRLADATAALEAVLERQPDHGQARFNLGMACLEAGRAADADEAFARVLAARPGFVPALVGRARALQARNRLEEARSTLDEARARAPADPAVATAHGGLLAAGGELDAARSAYEAALANAPRHGAAIMGLAELDRLEDAAVRGIERLQPLLAGGPPGGAIVLMARLLREAGREPEAERFVRQHLSAETVMPGVRAALLRELGHVLDARGDHDGAWSAWTEAHGARSGRFDPEQFDRAVAALIDAFPPERLPPATPGSTPGTTRPLLIVGAPRAGKSVLEQLLACHPAIQGAGELRHLGGLVGEVERLAAGKPYPAGLGSLDPAALDGLAADYARALVSAARGAPWVVDTQPTNCLHVGLARLLAPDLRVVWLRRDPRDLARACYARGFADAAFDFAAEPTGVGRYLGALARLRRHWRSLMPGQCLTVDYERLVIDPEGQVRRVLDHLGLSWDPACGDYDQPGRASLSAPPAFTGRLDARDVGRGHVYADRFPGLPVAAGDDDG